MDQAELDKLAQLNKDFAEIIKLQRAILALQKSSIPKYLSQARLYLLNQTSLNFALHTQSQVLMRVNCILVIVTSAAVLQIAERQIPFNSTEALYLGDDGMLIRPEDLITLTQTNPGTLGLEFFGQEMADRGARW